MYMYIQLTDICMITAPTVILTPTRTPTVPMRRRYTTVADL